MSDSPERWMPVPDFESLYEISDYGNVRSSRSGPSTAVGRVLKPSAGRGGYPRVVLSRDGNQRRFAIHRLVAAAFIGPAPTPEHQVNHKNGIKSDNRLENLEWVTCRENKRHALLTGLSAGNPVPGERNGSAKLTWMQVAEIRALRGQVGARQIAKRYGVSRSAIQFIHQGKKWRPENESAVSSAPLPAGERRGRQDWLPDTDAAKIRRACGLSQRTLRTALGIPRATFSRWERGQNAPSGAEGAAYYRVMAGLARHLEIPEDRARGAAAGWPAQREEAA